MNSQGVRSAVRLLCCGVFLGCPIGAATERSPQADSASRKDVSPIRSYTVNKKVSEFPAGRDLSTPEAAYATIMRDFMATGASRSEWAEVSAWRSQETKRSPVAPDFARNCLEARIEEVIIYRDRLASVLAKMKEGNTVGYDRRTFFLRDGRWLNVAQGDLTPTVEEARQASARWCDSSYRSCMENAGEPEEPRWHRPPVADPESYLKPYVEFLRERGREPHAFVMEALARYELVVMGEIHHRPVYWAFNRDLVRDPAFAEAVGTIYLELPSNHQQNIEAFLAGATCQKELVIQMLRDFFELGWPCQPTLEFLVAVWEVNQKLSPDRKLRLRLVDMQRPWEKIHKLGDWAPYEVDRDLLMAQNILKDRQTRRDKRHGFFIVGMRHAMEGLYYSDQTTRCHSAGWHLKQVLGEQLFTVFQHAPVHTDDGDTRGRLALGLIDSALAQLQDRPVAFTLREGPFGTLPFDGSPDAQVYGRFRDGYDAYLYLTPLEEEIFSPLIGGFYSDEFVREADRRWQLMHGSPLFSDGNAPTPERVIALRASWGRPRDWIHQLGPKNVWQYGDGWQTAIQQERERRVTRQELVAELDKIYRRIKEIDPKKCSQEAWAKSVFPDTYYRTATNLPALHAWWWNVLQEHPLESVEYGELSRDRDGLPQIPATVTLQGGIRFSKMFGFTYLALQQAWRVGQGLDLHLDPQWKDLPKTKKESPQ